MIGGGPPKSSCILTGTARSRLAFPLYYFGHDSHDPRNFSSVLAALSRQCHRLVSAGWVHDHGPREWSAPR
jgi:hypothetical protein